MIYRVRRSWWVYLLIGVVWAEVSLQLFAVGYRWWAARTRTRAPSAAELTILCLGDSYTYGAGAEADQSYPSHLERLLRARWPGRTIRVVNAGMGGVNSSQVLHRLPQELGRVRPDLVLLLTGSFDGVNFQGVDPKTLQAVAAPWPTRLQIRLDQWGSRLQLYRFVKHLVSPQRGDGGPSRAAPTVSAGTAPEAPSRERLLAALDELLQTEPSAARLILKDSARGYDAQWSIEELHDRVLPWVQQALQQAPSDVKSLLRLGRLFRRSARVQGAARRQEWGAVAQQVHARALALAATESEALWAQAELYETRREFTRAQPLWEQLIEQDPASPTLYVRLANAQMKRGAGEDAIASARTALTLNPEEPGAYHLLGEVFKGRQRWGQAQAMFRRAVELEPSRAESWLGLAWVSEALGHLDLARQAWREAFRWKPDPWTLAELGHTYQDPGEGREAMRAILNEVRVAAFQDHAYWEPHERLVAHGVYGRTGEQLLALNLERIIAQVTTQGIRLGVLTYPDRPMEDRMNGVVRQAAMRHPDVLLIDVQGLADRFADPALDLMSPDGYHPNARGYQLMARHVMDTLVAAGALPAPEG